MKLKNFLVPLAAIIALVIATVSIASAQSGEDAPAEAQAAEGEALVVDGVELPPTAGGELAASIAAETADETRALTGVFVPDPNELEETEEDDVRPSPPSIGADVPVTYFGPPPSTVNENLVGPNQLLTAGILDEDAGTIELPLYQGRLENDGPRDGQNVWYIVTDTSDEGNAEGLGLNFSAKLNFTDNPPVGADEFEAAAVRRSFYDQDGTLIFAGGAVDFRPERIVNDTSGDASGTNNLLDSLEFQAGAVGTDVGDADGFYSPLTIIENAGGHTYNAPMVSMASENTLLGMCGQTPDYSLVHDSVLEICPGDNGEPGTVLVELEAGFSFGRPVLYISSDANAEVAASLESAVFAPALDNIPIGRDDSLFSGIERIFGWTNGPTNDFGEQSPQRQGFNSAILGEGGPLNVLGGIPTIATDYSPLWDLNLGEWTQEAIDLGFRSRLTEEFQILGLVESGFITGPGGTPFGSSGVLINCPIVHRFL